MNRDELIKAGLIRPPGSPSQTVDLTVLATHPRYEATVAMSPVPVPQKKIKARLHQIFDEDGGLVGYGESKWYNDCGRKVAYFNRVDAEIGAYHTPSRDGEQLQVYICNWCGWHHAGNVPA